MDKAMFEWRKAWRWLWVLAAVIALGYVAALLHGKFKLSPTWQEDMFASLQYMLVFALLIERSVEVYLGAANLNGDDRFDVEAEKRTQDAKRPASIASIALGILVALSGIRMMQSIGSLEGGSALADVIWAGVDILVSGGLMAGGSALIHEVTELLRGTLKRVSLNVSTVNRNRGLVDAERSVSAAASYAIAVARAGPDSGRLTFYDGSVKVETACWWDPENVIAAGVYGRCSKTRMETKKDSVTGEKRPGIYLPTAVSPKSGEHTIFIHEGTGPDWSDGCIVLVRAEMMNIWNHIKPVDGKNVTITVTDT